MAGEKDSVQTLCPFFVKERAVDTSISCEGFCDDVRSIHTLFKSGHAKKKHQAIFCKTHDYKKCEIYRMIKDAKYEED